MEETPILGELYLKNSKYVIAYTESPHNFGYEKVSLGRVHYSIVINNSIYNQNIHVYIILHKIEL